MIKLLKKIKGLPPINFILKCYGYLRFIIQSAKKERPITAIFYILNELLNLTLGYLSASVVGWPKSFLGRGAKILGTKGISVGINANIKRQAWIEAVFSYNQQSFSPLIKIGQNFSSSDRLHISAINRIEIGDNCLFGSGVYISDHNHGVYKGSEQSLPSEPPLQRKLTSFGPVIMGSNVWLGDNVVIVGPVNIGNGVIIAANSVVTHNVPDFMMAAGVPVKIIKSFNFENNQWEKFKQ